MRKIIVALLLLLSFLGCNRDNKQAASDRRFYGHWMTINPNHEYFSLKDDGTYTDLRYTPANAQLKGPTGVSWVVKGNLLCLNYDFDGAFLGFKKHYQFTVKDTVILITDSTLVLAKTASKKHPSKWISLIKMKENGKYTTE